MTAMIHVKHLSLVGQVQTARRGALERVDDRRTPPELLAECAAPPRCDRIAMLLPGNRTEQRWWHDLVEPWRLAGALDVRFLAGRRRFDRPGWTRPAKGDRPPFGLCLAVWR